MFYRPLLQTQIYAILKLQAALSKTKSNIQCSISHNMDFTFHQSHLPSVWTSSCLASIWSSDVTFNLMLFYFLHKVLELYIQNTSVDNSCIKNKIEVQCVYNCKM